MGLVWVFSNCLCLLLRSSQCLWTVNAPINCVNFHLFVLHSCPEEEDEYTSESEEEKRAAEARFQKIQKLQGIWKLVTSFTHFLFCFSLYRIFFMTLLIFCTREADEPGPTDLLQLRGEAADLRGALGSEREDERFARQTGAACPAALRGRAPGCCRDAGCSSVWKWDISHSMCRNKHQFIYSTEEERDVLLYCMKSVSTSAAPYES